MGGSYFLFNQITTHASVFVSVHLYVSAHSDDSDQVSAHTLWVTAGVLFLMWAASYALVASMAKKQYRHMFYSPETSGQYLRRVFTESKTDEQKMRIFAHHRMKWKCIEVEVKEFTFGNWATWRANEETWLETIIASIPDEFIPPAELAALNAVANGGKRRRSSVGIIPLPAEA
jgi:hypothetical protein